MVAFPNGIAPAVKVCKFGIRQDHLSRRQASRGDKHNGYVVVNASPDLRQQILQTPQLHPKSNHPEGVRNTPIKAVIVTNADVDNVAGLLNLREKQAFRIYGPTKVLQILQDNSIFAVLDPEFVKQCPLETTETISPVPGIEIELFTVAGKAPLYLEDPSESNLEILDSQAVSRSAQRPARRW